MATAPVLLSMEEYLRSSYHPDADYVDGEIEERDLGKYEHGKIQGWIFQIFNLNAAEWSTDVTVEQRVRVRTGAIRVCDVAVMRASAPQEDVVSYPPLVCVEILSPEDRIPRAKIVLADYLAMGVENIWLIDPTRRAAYTFDASGLHEADPTNLTIQNTSIRLDLTPAFAAIEKKL